MQVLLDKGIEQGDDSIFYMKVKRLAGSLTEESQSQDQGQHSLGVGGWRLVYNWLSIRQT